MRTQSGRESGRGRRFTAGSALLTAVVLAAAGCSGSNGSRGASAAPTNTDTSSSPVPTTSAPVAPTTSAPATTALASSTDSAPPPHNTGDYLKILLPSSNTNAALLGLGPSLPAGWTAHTDESDSGSTPTAPAASLVGDGTCTYLTPASGGLDLAVGLSVATASESLGNGTAPIGLAFYAYNHGDAAKSLGQVRQNIASTCDDFTATPILGTVEVKVTVTPVSGIGDEAMLVKTIPQGAYLSEENLLVRRGDLVMSLWGDDHYGSLPDLTPAASALVTGMS